MKGKLRKILWFIGGIVLLQQLLHRIGRELPAVREQRTIIESRQLEPALLFYTESAHVLKAEKTVCSSLERSRHP